MSADDVMRVIFPPMPWQVALLVYPLTLSLALTVGMGVAIIFLAVLTWRSGWAFGGWAMDQWEAGRA